MQSYVEGFYNIILMASDHLLIPVWPLALADEDCYIQVLEFGDRIRDGMCAGTEPDDWPFGGISKSW